MSDSDVGLENWQQCLHEVSRRRLARITKTLRWIRSEVSTLPVFDGLSDIEIFVQEYKAQLPCPKRLQHLVFVLRATPVRWWTVHQRNIATWDTCRRLLLIRFGADIGGIESLYDRVLGPTPHIRSYEEAWKDRSKDEWVHLFVHTLDSSPRYWYAETELRQGTENWQTLRENLYLTFDRSEYPSVDDALELLHIRIADDPLPISIQTHWTTQIENAKECYNFSIEEDDDP